MLHVATGRTTLSLALLTQLVRRWDDHTVQEPFYKGGKVKARVPGWCDRVVCHSMPECRDTAFAEPVQLKTSTDSVIVVRPRSTRARGFDAPR